MKDLSIYYSVGALLYCPANNPTIVSSLSNEKFGTKFSLALCLEDTINDNFVEEAERIMIDSLKSLHISHLSQDFYLPKIFIRVRTAAQMIKICKKLDNAISIITGFIAPKFDLSNADSYIQTIKELNNTYSSPLYLMPIFESATIINLRNRFDILYTLKEKLDSIEPYVLNIRVGGNDLSHAFGLRRHVDETIHDIHPVMNILTDILTVFGTDYVVSGPVWEYYSGKNWDKGLTAELKKDLLCGFIGKTVIHPNQIDIVNQSLMISHSDYSDAKSILNWDDSSKNLVSGSTVKERMNEYKTHSNWALKTIFLAEYYGIKIVSPATYTSKSL